MRTARASAILAATLLLGAASPSWAAVFTVSNTNDSGTGSLRQAILDNNAKPGGNVIEIKIVGRGPHVIKPTGKLLPPIIGPATVKGTMQAPAGGGAPVPVVVLDGSGIFPIRTPTACPGATASYNFKDQQWEYSRVAGTGPNVRGYWGAGLAVLDSHDVEITGLEIRNFCIGVATIRSNHVNVHHMKIVDSHGAAGVIFTGDDDASGSTPLSFNNRLADSTLLDNGDGFEFTRGTHDSLLENNYIALTQPLPVDGNAVEYASSGPKNSMIGNTFTNYVDTSVTVGSGGEHTIRNNKIIKNKGAGMSVGGNNNLITGNTFSDNGGTAITIGGSGTKFTSNVVSGNGNAGVMITGSDTTISKNTIFGNKGLAIDVAPMGANASDDTGHNAPTIDAASQWTRAGLDLRGTLVSRPKQTYTIELFASSAAATGITTAPPVRNGPPGTDQPGALLPAGGVAAPGAAMAPPAADAARGGGRGARGGGRGGTADATPATTTATATPTGDGEKYLGTVTVMTDAKGHGTFTLTVPGADPLGASKTSLFVAGTATDAAGNTSEFGQARSLIKK